MPHKYRGKQHFASSGRCWKGATVFHWGPVCIGIAGCFPVFIGLQNSQRGTPLNHSETRPTRVPNPARCSFAGKRQKRNPTFYASGVVKGFTGTIPHRSEGVQQVNQHLTAEGRPQHPSHMPPMPSSRPTKGESRPQSYMLQVHRPPALGEQLS